MKFVFCLREVLHVHRKCFVSRLYDSNSVMMMIIATIFHWNFNCLYAN